MPSISDSRQIEGARALSRQITALGKKLGGKTLRSASNSAMLPVVKQAKSDAPRGTVAHKTYKGRLVAPGFLSRNIRRRSSLSRDKSTAFVSVGVSQEAFYGVQFVEVGTAKQPAQPWLVGAYDAHQQQVVERFTKQARKLVEKAAKTQ